MQAFRSRPVLYLLVLALFSVGVTLIIYRNVSQGVPLLPSENRSVWFVDAKIDFRATGGPVTVSFALPVNQPGFTILRENLISPGYGVAIVSRDDERRAEWTIAEASGRQTLYYKAQFAADNKLLPLPELGPPLANSNILQLEGAAAEAARQVLEAASSKGSGPVSLARQLLKILTAEEPNQAAKLLREEIDPSELLVWLLTDAGVLTRNSYALELEDGRRRQRLRDFVEVYEDGDWTVFDPVNGTEGYSDDILLWGQGATGVVDVIGGRDSDLTFSILRQEENALTSILGQLEDLGQDEFSIYRLPLEEQTLLKGMLLIPIGALVVVFMRVLVGIETSGTFMPVLLAVAFIQTELLPGLISFVMIVGTGLFVRSYLSRINLLLTARISATLIVVIGLTILFTLLSERMGLSSIQNFAFFPLVIMAWTVERMSILWEEEGPTEVLTQGLGSLLVAVLAYALMATPLVRHLSFNFLGLQLVLLAIILLFGQYTGYRVTELIRFRSLRGD